MLRRTGRGRRLRRRRGARGRRRRGSEEQNRTGEELCSLFFPVKFLLYRVALIQQQKIDLVNEIPEEPESTDPTAVRVLIKLPGGQVSLIS